MRDLPRRDVRGYIDDPPALNRIVGWASGPTAAPVEVRFMRDGQVVATAPADGPRGDLPGDHAFELVLPAPNTVLDLVLGTAELMAAQGDVIWRIERDSLRLRERALGEVTRLLRMAAGPRVRFAPGVDRLRESLFRLTPGAVSPNDATIVGADGHLFIYEGGNNFVQQHGASADQAREVAESWAAVFSARKARAAALGVRYLHLLIPEKSSVHRDSFPYALDGPTAYYRAVSEAGAAVLDADHLDVFPALEAAAPDARFQQTDSHLNAKGCLSVVQALAARVGAEVPAVLNWGTSATSGDLTVHFQGAGLHQLVPRPRLADAERIDEQVRLEDERTATSGHHRGIMTLWSNPNAPDPRRVLVFGNSFFSMGDRAEHLTWWLARIFTRTKFVWAADIDWEDVEAFAPDIVITQTVERFLLRTPST